MPNKTIIWVIFFLGEALVEQILIALLSHVCHGDICVLFPGSCLMTMGKDTGGREGSGFVSATMLIDDSPCTHNETLAGARYPAAFVT